MRNELHYNANEEIWLAIGSVDFILSTAVIRYIARHSGLDFFLSWCYVGVDGYRAFSSFLSLFLSLQSLPSHTIFSRFSFSLRWGPVDTTSFTLVVFVHTHVVIPKADLIIPRLDSVTLNQDSIKVDVKIDIEAECEIEIEAAIETVVEVVADVEVEFEVKIEIRIKARKNLGKEGMEGWTWLSRPNQSGWLACLLAVGRLSLPPSPAVYSVHEKPYFIANTSQLEKY